MSISVVKTLERVKEDADEKLHTIITNVPSTIYSCSSDKHWTMEFISNNVDILSGYPATDFIQNSVRTYASIIYSKDQQLIKNSVLEGVGNKKPFSIEYRIVRADGTICWVLDKGQGNFDKQGNLLSIDGVITEITSQKEVEEELSRVSRVLQNVFDTDPNFIFVKDRNSKFVMVNKALADAYGSTSEDLIGKSDSDFNPNDEENNHFHQDDLEVINNRKEKLILEEKITTANGEIRWLQTIKRPLIEGNGEINYLLGVSTDITDRKKVSEKLTFQASHDALTGLINRREFEVRAEQLLLNVFQGASEHSLCFMDLDQFKVVNDTCGHIAGDELLRQLGILLEDAVGHRHTVARLGGDEFGVLIENYSLEEAHSVISTLKKVIQDYQFAWEGHNFKLGMSMGLVAITKKTTNLTELLRDADAACYMAKNKGRNRIHVYHDEDTDVAQHHGEIQWVTRIQHALNEDKFCLYAQPISPLRRNTDKHYEILIRMIDDEGELISPGAFLPAAERYNLVTQVDRWVIERSLRFLAENPAFQTQINFISINLSGQSLVEQSVLDFIITQLDGKGIDCKKICFEITETAAISNLGVAKQFMSTLKERGCQFALDDFGSGLSSFGYLKNLSVDYLKIDGMFVKDIVNDPIDHAMVKSINEIGQVMGMRTIAEFVENDEIKSMLEEIGVNYGQGYGIARPKPLEDLLD